jgi:hypothetical protein
MVPERRKNIKKFISFEIGSNFFFLLFRQFAISLLIKCSTSMILTRVLMGGHGLLIVVLGRCNRFNSLPFGDFMIVVTG